MCKSWTAQKAHLPIARLTLIADFASFVAAIVLLATLRWDTTGSQRSDSVDKWLLGWLIVGLVFSGVGIVLAIADIHGIIKNRYIYMLPFFFYLVVNALAFGFFAVAFLVLIILLSTSEEHQERHEQLVGRTHILRLIASHVVSAVATVLSAIFACVVWSHMKSRRSPKTKPKNILDERMKGRRFSWEMYSPVTRKPYRTDLVKIPIR